MKAARRTSCSPVSKIVLIIGPRASSTRPAPAGRTTPEPAALLAFEAETVNVGATAGASVVSATAASSCCTSESADMVATAPPERAGPSSWRRSLVASLSLSSSQAIRRPSLRLFQRLSASSASSASSLSAASSVFLSWWHPLCVLTLPRFCFASAAVLPLAREESRQNQQKTSNEDEDEDAEDDAEDAVGHREDDKAHKRTDAGRTTMRVRWLQRRGRREKTLEYDKVVKRSGRSIQGDAAGEEKQTAKPRRRRSPWTVSHCSTANR